MIERPILFSGEMVRALLAGTKTQTRRIIKPQPIIDNDSGLVFDGKHRETYRNDLFHADWREKFAKDWCPHGQPGDRLWVRETYKYGNTSDAFCTEFKADLDRVYWDSDKADALPDAGKLQAGWMDDKPWSPAIHMFRWASRLLLEITAVRCERLQEISEADAVAEGVDMRKHAYYENGSLMMIGEHNAGIEPFCKVLGGRAQYAWLWNGINGSRAWESNPWVWVVEFKVVW